MKITLIRHGKVNMDWKERYDSAGFDEAWAAYDHCDIFPISDHYEIPEGARVFVTPFKRTQETARQFLGVTEFTVIPELANEVPLRSYKDTRKLRKVGYMNFRGRFQWYFPTKRQPERLWETKERAKRLIRYLESETDNAVVVMHGFYLRTVSAILKQMGYKVENRPRFAVPNLHVVTAVKEGRK